MFYILLFISSLIITYVIKEYALKKSLLDIPNHRSSHQVPTPYGGGVAISIVWFFGITYLYITDTVDKRLFLSLMIGVFLVIVGFIDDYKRLDYKIRLFLQSFVSLISLYTLGGLKEINLGFFSIDNFWFCNFVSFLLIIWFINLYNFLDGIDGYAGSEAIFLGLSGFLIFKNSIFLVLVVSVSGFLVWNWHRAKIFMGDVGSTLLGYNIAVFTIYYTNIDSKNFWIWLTLFLVFWFDATYTLYRRFKDGEKLYKAHKKHIYQKLVQWGFSHDIVVIFFMLLNSVFFIFIMLFGSFRAFFISMVVLYFVIRYIIYKGKSIENDSI